MALPAVRTVPTLGGVPKAVEGYRGERRDGQFWAIIYLTYLRRAMHIRGWRDRLAWLLLISVYIVPLSAKGELSGMHSVFVERTECGPVVFAKDVLVGNLPVNIQTPLSPKIVGDLSLGWRLLETSASRYGDISGGDDILLCSYIVKGLHGLVFGPEMQISARTLMNGRRFPIVTDSIVHIYRRSSSGFRGQYEICGGYPCPLVNQEVMAHVVPLKVRNKGVDHDGDNPAPFKDFPPWNASIPTIIGALGIICGWCGLRSNYRMNLSGIVFFVSIALLIMGLSVLLPWSTVAF
jgi:hypothetical protein